MASSSATRRVRSSETRGGRTPGIVIVAKARKWLTELGVLTSRPAAFGIFFVYAVAWLAIGNGFEWHSFATLATWGMTLVIQRAEHRDTQAIHAKLDELLHATTGASNEVAGIDDKDAEEVEDHRSDR